MMPQLHFPYREQREPVAELVGPENAPLQWLRMRSIRLTSKAPEWKFDLGSDEGVLDIFGGLCSVNIVSEGGNATFPEVGGRINVFAGKPTMVYLPRGSRGTIFCE